MTKRNPTAKFDTSDGSVAVRNRLGAGHRYKRAVDNAILRALHGLPGPWDVSVYTVGRAWFRIDVIAPDGASWSLSVDGNPRAADLAKSVRAACYRHCRLKPGAEEPGRAGTEPSSPAGRRGIES